MQVNRLDHLVLTVIDINKSVAFYTSLLGMQKEVFGEGRVALVFGNQKINLHEYKNEFEPKAAHPLPGSEDLCFIIESDLHEAIEFTQNQGITIVEGPIKRTGATGSITSFYVRDPDENLIEVATYN